MEPIFVLLALPVVALTLIMFAGTVIRFVKSFKHLYEPMKTKSEDGKERTHKLAWFNYKISPVIISVIAPLGGFYMSANFNSHLKYDDLMYTPLNHDHMLTIFIFYAISLVSYWMSYLGRNKMSPLINALTLLGMTEGFVLCLFLTIHFGPFILFGFFPALVTFPLLSPLLFALLLFVEIRRQFHLYKEETLEKEADIVYDSLVLSTADKVVKSSHLENPVFFLLLLPFMAIQQAILILFGQQPDSFIKAFAETCTFTFSQFPPPPNPGDSHYLCTIASRGSKKLVKPMRKGWRGGKMIDVNRQLLISNAFEEWLEEYTPVFHYYLRRFYTRVARPLNEMVQSTRISNMVFIMMKPLEWFFLVWLYLVDEKPENRIHRQYLSKRKGGLDK